MKSLTIRARITPEQRDAWFAAARGQGMRLSEWLRLLADRAAATARGGDAA